MKHQDEELRTRLVDESAALGVELSDIQAVQLLDYLHWLLSTNEIHNLTAITSPDAAVSLHLVDSLTVVEDVVGSPLGRVLDLGTGGGLPGIPLCIVTGREFHLLDATRKKTEALSEYISARGLSASVMNGRAEELAVRLPSAYSCVVARAVAPLPSLVELGSPLLEHKGILVCMKGDPGQEEVESGAAAAAVCGLELISARRMMLAGGQHRSVFVYQRTQDSRIDLPRGVGRAQKRPLA